MFSDDLFVSKSLFFSPSAPFCFVWPHKEGKHLAE